MDTGKEFLVPADPRDGEKLLAFHKKNREFLYPWEPMKPPEFYTITAQLSQLRTAQGEWVIGRTYRFHIYAKGDFDTIIGVVSLGHVIRGSFLSGIVSYKMDEDWQNRGCMSRCVAAITEYAFRTLKLHRLEANVMPRNGGSLRVLEKCGYSPEGLAKDYLEICGKWEDHIHMVILNRDM